MSAFEDKADMPRGSEAFRSDANDPKRSFGLRQSRRLRPTATSIPASWATTKAATPPGAIPANVSESDRAMVTAGLAKEVEAVNQ